MLALRVRFLNYTGKFIHYTGLMWWLHELSYIGSLELCPPGTLSVLDNVYNGYHCRSCPLHPNFFLAVGMLEVRLGLGLPAFTAGLGPCGPGLGLCCLFPLEGEKALGSYLFIWSRLGENRQWLLLTSTNLRFFFVKPKGWATLTFKVSLSWSVNYWIIEAMHRQATLAVKWSDG